MTSMRSVSPYETIPRPRERRPRLSLAGTWMAAILVAAAVGCSEDHSLDSVLNEADPQVSGVVPPVPASVNAEVSSRSVRLTWSLNDSSHVNQVEKYRVYVQRPGEAIELADSAAAPPVAVGSLDNGTSYRFRVSSVLTNGLEGRRSGTITAAPGVFGVLIAGGVERVSSTRVTLNLQAPAGTQGVRISNDPASVTAASIRPFAANVAWDLEPEEGSQTVYAQFVDGNGNLSTIVSDGVFLDRGAEIASVSFSPSSAAPGQIVQFSLDAGEPFGEAAVQLGSTGPRLVLHDDGQGGDGAANDGVYELDYEVESNIELFEVLVTGFFTDEAGNEAEPRIAPGRLTIHLDPTPVTLDSPTSPGPQELRLTWTQAVDADRFAAYRVLRAQMPDVAANPAATEVERTTNRTNTEFVDGGLDPSKTYYYVVQVEDDFGNKVASNEVSGQPQANAPPDPVTLEPPSEVTEASISLRFSRSFAEDFDAYRIIRGFLPDLDDDPDRRVISTIQSITETTYIDRTEIEENRTYYYRVDVVDELGASAPSNVVSVTTPDLLPEAIDLNAPGSVGETSVLLRWAPSDDRDFDRYEIRRATEAGVDESVPVLVTITTKEQSSYLDRNLVENTEYFYRLFVVDRGGNRVGGDELEVTTANANPDAVTLSAPVEVAGAATPTLTLSWTESNEHDFSEYRLYRDTNPAVSEASTLVRTVVQSGVTSFLDSDLDDNTRYYYRVFVVDDAGGTTGSNEQSVVTANRPPSASTLSVSATTPTSISLSWTQNNDADFEKYRLLRGTNNTDLNTIVVELFQREQTGHTVFVAESDSSTIFFKLQVFDDDIDSSGSLSSDSNVVSARTSE